MTLPIGHWETMHAASDARKPRQCARRSAELSWMAGCFVDEFAKDLNATAAYRRAGYRPPGA